MSSDSIQSKPIHFFDVPEVKSFDVDYRYNFFISDESIDESGNEALNGNLSKRFLRKGTADSSNLNARIPRYVSFSLSLNDSKKPMMHASSAKKSMAMTKEQILDALNKGLVVTEDDASESVYHSLTIGNTAVDSELENLMRLTLNRYVVNEASIMEAINEFSQRSNVPSNTISILTPSSLNDKPQKSSSLSTKKSFDDVRKIRSQVQLNRAYAPAIMARPIEEGLALMDKELAANYYTAVANSGPDKDFQVTEEENIFDIPPIYQQKVSSPHFVPEALVVGVLVEKNRIFKGKKYPMPSIVVTGNRPTEGYDSQVAYGQTYEYVCRTLAKFKIPATTDDGRVFIQTFLVASKPTSPVRVTLKEDRAPDHPQDINYYYEYSDDSLYITWSPPVNPQRDVKYYQVFRRSSTDEAFELIANLDFDDSVVRSNPVEAIDPSLTKSFKDMPTFYIDHEFDKTKSYIYSLVSVDARQISSTYSPQIRVSFDTSKNKIKKESVCYGGAPKQYPNWTMQENFFVDSMKDSSHKNVNIYFNPEAYTLIRGNGDTIPAFYSTTIDPLSKYVFQFINTDRLLEQKFEVVIDDSDFKKDFQGTPGTLREDDNE
jgi:hypothetical protein